MHQIVEYPWCNPLVGLRRCVPTEITVCMSLRGPAFSFRTGDFKIAAFPAARDRPRKAQTEAKLAGYLESRCRNSRCPGWSISSECLWQSPSCRARNEPRMRSLIECVGCARSEPIQTDAEWTRAERCEGRSCSGCTDPPLLESNQKLVLREPSEGA